MGGGVPPHAMVRANFAKKSVGGAYIYMYSYDITDIMLSKYLVFVCLCVWCQMFVVSIAWLFWVVWTSVTEEVLEIKL